MSKKELLAYSILALIAVIVLLYYIALIHAWYWRLPWFDVVMHFLGGVFVGLCALYVYYYSGYISPLHTGSLFVYLLPVFVAALVGVMWEFFEFTIDQVKSSTVTVPLIGDLRDTLSDLLFDLLGALGAAALFRGIWQRR